VDQVLRWFDTKTGRANLAEAGRDRQHAITILERIRGCGHSRLTKAHARVQRVITRKRAQSLQGCGNRGIEEFGNSRSCFSGVNRTPTDKQPGFLRPVKRAGRHFNGFVIRFCRFDTAYKGFRFADFAREQLDIDRDLDEYRARLAAGGGLISLENGRDDLIVIFDLVSLFGNRRQQGMLVYLV